MAVSRGRRKVVGAISMKLRYTPKAREDLQNIKNSIIEKFDSEELADRVLRQITTSVRDLTVFPLKGRELKQLLHVKTEYRVLFCKKNYIFYRVEKDEIAVIRILNEKQDYMRILFGISDNDA